MVNKQTLVVNLGNHHVEDLTNYFVKKTDLEISPR